MACGSDATVLWGGRDRSLFLCKLSFFGFAPQHKVQSHNDQHCSNDPTPQIPPTATQSKLEGTFLFSQ